MLPPAMIVIQRHAVNLVAWDRGVVPGAEDCVPRERGEVFRSGATHPGYGVGRVELIVVEALTSLDRRQEAGAYSIGLRRLWM